MIDDCRTSSSGRVHDGKQSRVVDIFRIERLVELPPEILQRLLEISCRLPRWSEATREGRVKMVVGVDQAGHDEAAPGIDSTIDLVLVSREIADVNDVIAFDENAAVFDKAVVLIKRDEVSIGDQ